MSYLFKNYKAHDMLCVDDSPMSPYLEVNYVAGDRVGVNVMLRFHEIFEPLFEIEDHSERYAALENCLLHYLAQLDRESGLHVVSFSEHALDDELRSGAYGSEAQEIYSSLSASERRILLIYLRRHNAAQGRRCFFFDAVSEFFPGTKSWFNEFEEKFLFQIPAPESEHNRRLIDLLSILLLDMGVEIEIFWNSRFGLIGDESMRIDEFVIY